MPLELLRSDLKDYQSASNLQFNEQIKELIAKGGNIYHFGFGESPFPVPECFREGLVRSAHRNEYLSVQGLLPLREKIIRFHKQFGDFDHFSPNQLVLGTGSKELIYHIMNVFGGEILLPSPSWTSYLPQTVLSGRKSIVVDGHLNNRYVPTAEAIEKAISQGDPALPKLIVLNSPNNPTGAVYNEQQLRDIAQVCRKYNVVVLSDEIYARTATVPFNSIAKYYSEGTIVTTGFSKWASLGGWRAGYALFPPELGRLQEAVTSAGSHSFTCQAAPVQHALSFGLDHLSELEDYIKRTRTVLSMTGTYCHRELHKVGVIGNEPEGAYYFMPDFEVCRSKDVSNGTELCNRLLAEASVALMPCDPHYIRPAGELTTRFAFVNFNGSEAIKEVPLERMLDEACEEEFLRQYCPRLVEGVNAITHWVMRNGKEQAN